MAGRSDQRGLRAPVWLEQLVRTSSAPVPWRDVVRFAVAVPAPLAVALLLAGGPGSDRATVALAAGVFATVGALAASLAPQAGPLRDRLRRTAASAGFGALGLTFGPFAAGAGWQPVLIIALLSLVAAAVSAVSAALSLGGLQLLIYAALASGLDTPLPLLAEVACFAAGAAWGTLATLLQARTEPVDPDRAAVAAVFARIGDLLESAGGGTRSRGGRWGSPVPALPGEASDDARRALTLALNQAYDRVIRSRGLSAGRSRQLSELAGVLNAAAPLVEGAVTAARSGRAVDDDDVRAVRALATAVATDSPLEVDRPPPLETGTPARRAVRHGVRLVWNVVGDPEERAVAAVARARVDRRARLRELLERALAGRDGREFAARLVLCMTAAEIARQVLPLTRPYWVLLTVALVLKPDFGSVFARAVQRGAGTLLGVLVGSALLALLDLLPGRGWVLLVMAGTAAVLPWARTANFGLFSVFQTPVIILLLDLALPTEPGLVGARLADTLVGCGIVLVLGYLVWPQTWRAPLDQALRGAADALDGYVAVAFTGSDEDIRRARRGSYRALTEVQTQLQRRLAEPPPISSRAVAWWPVIVQLERASDAVTEAVIAVRSGAPAPDPAQVAVLRKAVRRFEDDVAAHRLPDDAEILAEGVLAPIAREVDTARRLVRESGPG